MTGMPVDLAKWSRAAAHSLTCVMLPGLLSTASVAIVWIESMTTSSGPTSLMFSKMSLREVSQRMVTLSWSVPAVAEGSCLPMRWARILS